MLVVGDSLKKLLETTDLAPLSSFDNTCVRLSLSDTIVRLLPLGKDRCITYGDPMPQNSYQYETIKKTLILQPKEALLASSTEEIKIPVGYFGLLQTKGSLARLMVSLHFSDGQVDPGFVGHITFEIFNASDNKIEIPINAAVGNLYILKTDGAVDPYKGKYFGSTLPTIQK